MTFITLSKELPHFSHTSPGGLRFLIVLECIEELFVGLRQNVESVSNVRA